MRKNHTEKLKYTLLGKRIKKEKQKQDRCLWGEEKES